MPEFVILLVYDFLYAVHSIPYSLIKVPYTSSLNIDSLYSDILYVAPRFSYSITTYLIPTMIIKCTYALPLVNCYKNNWAD